MHIGVPGTRARVGIMCGYVVVVVGFSVIVDASFEQNSFFISLFLSMFSTATAVCALRSALCCLQRAVRLLR